MSEHAELECREVYDLKNYTITLYAPDGFVLRRDQYSEKSFPVIFQNLPQDVVSVTQTTWRLPAEVERLRLQHVCQCPSYANAKGPYPSGFCPDCGKWYPGIDRAEAIKRGHIPPKA